MHDDLKRMVRDMVRFQLVDRGDIHFLRNHYLDSNQKCKPPPLLRYPFYEPNPTNIRPLISEIVRSSLALSTWFVTLKVLLASQFLDIIWIHILLQSY